MPTVIENIACHTQGSGEPVALVSGLAQVGARWRRVAAMLEDRFEVVTIDNRECGATGPCPGGFGIDDMGADVLAAMSRLGHERFFLAGISMGGMIAQEVIRQAPDRVRAAVLLATSPGQSRTVQGDPSVLLPPGERPDPSDREAMLVAARGTWARLAGPGFAEAHPDVIDEEARLSLEAATPLDGIMRQLQAILAWDPGDALVGTDVPVVVAHGDADPLVPYENGVRVAELLGAELVTYEGAGHVLESERAGEVAGLLASHFTAVSATR